ncbi:hypothetical protein JBO41_17455 [Enterobacter asburiae]|uniref:hypothetical protein n=1 Tax=Enterobacter asburiae TaxID=61645 RepID=UPI001750B633|nr:hypothetical protein [Enterobacter asburiae]EFN8927562.1 hypothetical protein [Escherichia coli]EHP6080485.1 hypothetical protein [Escherichia coli]ELY7446539.1 hypothetical protein [Escherichia coli]MBL5913975.1 hypothetical protein [Enterobacter asburiae]MBL5918405.1 hypothetical protein [Enterobacter asburiae]
MSRENNGGPAFPTQGYEGVTLRDYFAAKALAGWLASFPGDDVHPVVSGVAEKIAEQAYALADAMIKAREAS